MNVDKKDSIPKRFKAFVFKHRKKFVLAGGTLAVAFLGYKGYQHCQQNGFTLFKSKTPIIKLSTANSPEPEVMYKGVPLSQLNDLSKRINKGIGCSIDQWGFLVFTHKSNRGHLTFGPQMCVENGKLVNLGGHYPNQWWSAADEFAKQANETFSFTE